MSVPARFTEHHRSGDGAPLVLLHGLAGTWRTWELVLPELERRHAVFAPTLPGHAGGPPLPGAGGVDMLLDQVEGMLDEAGIGVAHLAGNSLGGYLALRLAARGRAASVVALAPAGGWAESDPTLSDTLSLLGAWKDLAASVVPHLDAILEAPGGRRQLTASIMSRHEHVPADLIAHQVLGSAACDAFEPVIETAVRKGYSLDTAAISCPVRVVWGTSDRILPWPSAAARYLGEWLPEADWVTLEGAGHCLQLDAPLETARLIGDFTRLPTRQVLNGVIHGTVAIDAHCR